MPDQPQPTPPPLASMPLFAEPLVVHHPEPRTNGDGPTIRRPITNGPAENYHRPAPRPTPRPAPTGADVDWRLVRSMRSQAADRLAAHYAERPELDEAAHREWARGDILDLLRAHDSDAAISGQRTFAVGEQQQLVKAIFDSIFGLGRLQPLVDNPMVENISAVGCDNVRLLFADGHHEVGPAVADTDEEMIADIQFLASRPGTSDREFSRATPILDIRLPAGERLAARAWISPRPLLSIRLHRLRDIDLSDLVANGTLDDNVASFLRAAVRARMSIVVTGDRGAGKTVLLRALCAELHPTESVCTIETEYELMLDEMPRRHHEVFAMEARPGGNERGPDGSYTGEVTVDRLLYSAMRLPANRLIIGEVRGKEIITVFKAMQAGAGSMSTTHASSAYAGIDRLVTMAMDDGRVSQEFAQRQVASHINLIVHVTNRAETDNTEPPSPGDGQLRRHQRVIADIIALELVEDGKVGTTNVYQPGPDGRARPGHMPNWMLGLQESGFDYDTWTRRGGNLMDRRHSS